MIIDTVIMVINALTKIVGIKIRIFDTTIKIFWCND